MKYYSTSQKIVDRRAVREALEQSEKCEAGDGVGGVSPSSGGGSVCILAALKWRKNADKTGAPELSAKKNRRACLECGQNADIVIHDAYRHKSKKCRKI